MGILARFNDIMKANVNDLLDKMEDPAKGIDQALRDAQENLAQAKKETAGVMAEEDRCKRLLNEAKEEVGKWENRAKNALLSGAEDDARKALTYKQEAESRRDSAQATYEAAKETADMMRQMIDKLTKDIEAMNRERNEIKSKIAVARTQERINKTVSSMDTTRASGKFDRYKQKAENMLDRANAEARLNAHITSESEELAAKYDAPASDSVDAELEKLKREMGL